MLSRRRVLLYAAGLIGYSAARQVFAQTDGPLNFLVVGDWGKPRLAEQASRVARAMGLTADAVGARFVISTGDNFYERGVTSADDPLWQTLFENIYSAPSLECPWYVVLGNHDYLGNPDAELAYAQKSKRWKLPARYYAVRQQLEDGTTADFFFLDTEPFLEASWWNEFYGAGQAADAQIRWLEDGLRRSGADWKFVVGHHPVYSSGAHGNTPALVARVEPLLHQYGVRAYFNGHDHDLEHIEVDGLHYLTSGAGAETRAAQAGPGSLFAASELGFLEASLRREELLVRFIGADGGALHEAVIPRVAA